MVTDLGGPVPKVERHEHEAPEFDLHEFARTAVGSHRDELRLDEYQRRPLEPGTLRCLSFVRDVERSTMRYLRHVLVTPTHKDARITAFLTTWAFEKYWIADALDVTLAHHAREAPGPGSGRGGDAAIWRGVHDRFAPIRRALVDNTLGDDVIATHMAAGTVDEWITRAAYLRIARLEDHPELTRMITTLVGVKARHLRFFEAQARARLRRSSLACFLARRRLRRSLWPMNPPGDASHESAFFFGRVFSPVPALVEQLDRRIQALPGMAGITLAAAAVAAGVPQRRGT
ncbi:hypothetical protein G1H11_16000 [Phytoactinopolyspora alkaliphila]|uniref:Ferritin-like domain-containing protein n=1 Tax=Phytoactinopolyspora alkaliphila TaxID=1783498 RepID=A0A6N9YP89_9ACTN|nr:hypothetical protein [Phytoactinopolyspora alkaliphila]NED96813.1 hypothetical protein [Phytoactinopolyspora alkaliphila]